MANRILIPLLVFISSVVFAQKPASAITPSDLKHLILLEDSINHLAQIAVQDSFHENRIAANERLLPLIRTALAIPNSFNYPFSNIPNISIQQPEDKAFRVFTWQLSPKENTYKYFGFIQLNRSKSTSYELNDKAYEIDNPDKQPLTTDNWFGCLYYNIKSFDSKDGIKYLLFGYNGNNADEKIKVCEVLVLRGGAVRFGSPVFEVNDIAGQRKTTLHRLVLTYAADVVVRLNYDAEMGVIIHDHLEQMASKNPDLPFTYVPDGTYEAFELKKQVWQHIDKIPNLIVSEPPRPKPILGVKKTKIVDKEEAKSFKFPVDPVKQ